MSLRQIRDGETLLARFIPADAWKQGLSFFTDDSDFIQVGSWNYDAGKSLLPHVHNHVERVVLWTQEVIYVRKGSLLATVFNREGRAIEDVEVGTGDTLVLIDGGHGYKILEEGTEV